MKTEMRQTMKRDTVQGTEREKDKADTVLCLLLFSTRGARKQ